MSVEVATSPPRRSTDSSRSGARTPSARDRDRHRRRRTPSRSPTSAAATELRDELPDHRFADAWISADGIDDVLATDTGALGTLTPLIAPGASSRRGAVAERGRRRARARGAKRARPRARRVVARVLRRLPAVRARARRAPAPRDPRLPGHRRPGEDRDALLSQAGAQAPGDRGRLRRPGRTPAARRERRHRGAAAGPARRRGRVRARAPPGEGERR